MQCVCVCATVLTCVKCHYIYILELNMYLLVTYLPGSVASQGAIDLVAPKLLAINNKNEKMTYPHSSHHPIQSLSLLSSHLAKRLILFQSASFSPHVSISMFHNSASFRPPVSVGLFQSACFSPPLSIHLFQSACYSPPVSVGPFQSDCFSPHVSVCMF